MKLVDEWIIREVLDTLHMAHTTLLGITGLDSPQEVAEKSANETAITRRISKAIDLIQQQSGQSEVDLEKEIQEHIKECLDVKFPTTDIELIRKDVAYTARKFYELGLNARKGE